MKPYYQDSAVTIYHGDCRDILSCLPSVDLVLTDPPYPNNAGHFCDGIKAAIDFFKLYKCSLWRVFWNEITRPQVPLPLVAVHIWYRTNTNRPDNYEPIYEFNSDGIKRASRVYPFCVIYPGLTGINATGHPTEKNIKLISVLCGKSEFILDPFMGSGTTLRAAKDLNRKAIGIEIEEKYCEIAAQRMCQEVLEL
jgi:site-specific DNA-methyltransferase (adenine-specific)